MRAVELCAFLANGGVDSNGCLIGVVRWGREGRCVLFPIVQMSQNANDAFLDINACDNFN